MTLTRGTAQSSGMYGTPDDLSDTVVHARAHLKRRPVTAAMPDGRAGGVAKMPHSVFADGSAGGSINGRSIRAESDEEIDLTAPQSRPRVAIAILPAERRGIVSRPPRLPCLPVIFTGAGCLEAVFYLEFRALRVWQEEESEAFSYFVWH